MTTKTFNASRIAIAGAIGEYIDEPDMTTDEVLAALTKWGSFDPQINVLAEHRGKSGLVLLKEIHLTERGLMSLMTIVHQAGKEGRELI